jgi:hypothetical protein
VKSTGSSGEQVCSTHHDLEWLLLLFATEIIHDGWTFDQLVFDFQVHAELD